MAWELASGAKEAGLSALFRGASLLTRTGEAISVLAGLKGRTVLLYFASSEAEPCREFTPILRRFYELAREADDSIAVIFVSDDNTKEEQLAFFRGEDMHSEWLMVELLGVEDIMDAFDVEKIPSLVVLDRDGKSVVKGARDQVWDLLRAEGKEPAALKAAVADKWAEWRRLAGDWRASPGHALGGASSGHAAASSSSSGPSAPVAHGGAPGSTPAAGARSDREALRAARLAALERRGLGGGDGGGASGSGGDGPFGATTLTGGAAASSSSSAAAAPSSAFSVGSGSGARIATLSGVAAGAAGGGGTSSGSGTFAAGAAGASVLGGVAYTLAGGRVELPMAPAPAPSGAGSDEDVVSDMASDGGASFRDEGDLPVPDIGEAISQIAGMGFPADAARRALEASNGDIDQAVAMLLGE